MDLRACKLMQVIFLLASDVQSEHGMVLRSRLAFKAKDKLIHVEVIAS